jgi:DNA-binding transcriptional ArsR family regulator
MACHEQGQKNVTALCDGLGLKQPTVSHHLGLLRMGRLVVGTRKGKSVVYVTDAGVLKTLGVDSFQIAKAMLADRPKVEHAVEAVYHRKGFAVIFA